MKTRTGFVSNSSSSSFVCDTELAPGEVAAKLEELIKMYNKLMNKHYDYDSMFEYPRIGTPHTHKDWHDYEPSLRTAGGKIVIDSAGDNTIPYELFDLIEVMFEGVRCHLG